MLENDFKIRTKFINKLITKIEDLNDNFILLSKVDKKILKKMNNQIGKEINNQIGGNANSLILVALKKQKEMKEQQKKITDTFNKLQNIEAQMNSFNTTFGNIKNIISTIQFRKFDNLKIFENLDKTLDNNILTESDIDLLSELLDNDNNKYYNMTFKEFKEDKTINKDLKQKIDEEQFKILFKDDEVGATITPTNSDSPTDSTKKLIPLEKSSTIQRVQRAKEANKMKAKSTIDIKKEPDD